MSEVQAPKQETPVADPAVTEPVTTTASEANTDPIEPMATHSLAAESRSEAIPAVDGATTNAPTESPVTEPKEEKISKNEVLIEAQPINEGILGYKVPEFPKSLVFSKKFFWFSDEPIEPKQLSEYLRAEKPDTHHNVAHASQTGKGLLFFAKRVEDKDHPAGILNLSDVTEITKGEFNDFTFKIHGNKHGFQAPTKAQRDGWLVAIEASSTEAKATRETLIGSEGYKAQIEKLGKPALGAAPTSTSATASRSLSRTKKSTDGKVHDGALPTEASARSGSSEDEAKSKAKSKDRSQSRKRGSFFGAILGRKEEHDEKKEIKKEEKAEEKALKDEIRKEEKAEKKQEKEERNLEKQLEKEEKQLEKEEKKEAKDTKADEPAPLDAAAIASRAIAEPVIPFEGDKPVAADETAKPVTSEALATSPISETPPTKPTKRNSIFGSLFKKEPTSPVSKDTPPAVPVKDTDVAPVSATAPQIEDPTIVSSTEPTTASPAVNTTEAAPTTGTPTTTSPPSSGPEKRRSFFNNLGSRREKKTDTTSDTEITDGEGKKSTTGKFGGLFRKPSRAIPNGKNATDSAASPVAKESEPATSAAMGTSTTNEPQTIAPDEASKETELKNPTPVTASS